MICMDVHEVSPGMRLARDVHYLDPIDQRMVELKRGDRLTDLIITQLIEAEVSKLYVNIIPGEIKVAQILSSQCKQEALEGIQRLAEAFASNADAPQVKGTMSQLNKTAHQLTWELSHRDGIQMNILDLKLYDDYTFHHSVSVAVQSLGIGIELGLEGDILQDLVLSGLMHDIGKVAVPKEILNKPGRLTAEEFRIMKSHPVNAGAYLLKKQLVSQNVYRGVSCHHEKWDGTGYPSGLSGGHIPLFGRILAVADVYDALTSHRPYRSPSPPSEVVEYIMGGVGTYFDETVVRAFLKRIVPYPVGCHVRLSNGMRGVVIRRAVEEPLRPTVVADSGQVFDLMRDHSCHSITILDFDHKD